MWTLPFWREGHEGRMVSGCSLASQSGLAVPPSRIERQTRQKPIKTQDKSLSRHKTKAYQDSRQRLKTKAYQDTRQKLKTKTKTQDKNKRLKTKAYQDKSLSRQKPAYQDKSLSRQKTRWSNVKTKTTGISHTHSSI